MKIKKGFTLLELMVTLLILSVLSLMISTILIQSQKILMRTDKSSQIQNEVRNALFKIQTDSKNYKDIAISDKYGVFNNNKWELVETISYAREILRINNIENDIDKVYVEVYENNKHELIEFNIDKISNTIVSNSRTTLISNIQGNEVDKIKVYTEDIVNSNGQKISELITINFSDTINGNVQNESQYVISFKTQDTNIINIDLNIGNSNTGNGNNDSNNGDLGDNGSNNGDLDNDSSEDNSNIDESTPVWDSSKTYKGGEVVQYNGIIYRAEYYSINSNPEVGNAWTIISEEPTVWKSTKTYLKNQKVIYNEIIYEVAWDSTNSNPEVGNAWTIITEEPTVWKSTKVYLLNQKVSHNGKIYIANGYVNAGDEPGVKDVWKLVN